ncbi:MAG: beta-propeller domain-containing protein [Actinomycetota bacterium]|nr:beta-propeller domain-containing protein [Actinomycetota bacterium]
MAAAALVAGCAGSTPEPAADTSPAPSDTVEVVDGPANVFGPAAPVPVVDRAEAGAWAAPSSCDQLLDDIVTEASAAVGPHGFEASAPGVGDEGTGDRPFVARGAGPTGPADFEMTSTGTMVAAAAQVVDGADGDLIVALDGEGDVVVVDVAAEDPVGHLDLAPAVDDHRGLLAHGARAYVVTIEPVRAEVGDAPGAVWDAAETTIAEIDLDEPSAPEVVSTLTIDGASLGAVQRDGVATITVRHVPSGLPFVRPGDGRDDASALEANRSAVEGSTLDDWLAGWRLDGPSPAGGRLGSCDDVRRGGRLGLSSTTTFSVDLDAGLIPTGAVTVFGDRSRTLARAEHLWVAQPFVLGGGGGGHGTVFHQLSGPGEPPEHVGDVVIDGVLDTRGTLQEDWDGSVWLATNDVPAGEHPVRSTTVHALEAADGALEAVGALTFDGDVAVTFSEGLNRGVADGRLLDLREPAAPTVAGPVGIDGLGVDLLPAEEVGDDVSVDLTFDADGAPHLLFVSFAAVHDQPQVYGRHDPSDWGPAGGTLSDRSFALHDVGIATLIGPRAEVSPGPAGGAGDPLVGTLVVLGLGDRDASGVEVTELARIRHPPADQCDGAWPDCPGAATPSSAFVLDQTLYALSTSGITVLPLDRRQPEGTYIVFGP